MGNSNNSVTYGVIAAAAVLLAAPTGGASLGVLAASGGAAFAAGAAVGGKKDDRIEAKAKRTAAFEADKVNQRINQQQKIESDRARTIALNRSASLKAQRGGGQRSLLFGSDLGITKTTLG